MASNPGHPNYVRGFDGIRACAVILVMIHHKLWAVVPASINLGKTGVDLFFCLSGFLIVRILVTSRQRCETTMQAPATELKNFYMRRILRLSPPYFFYLIVALGLAAWHPAEFDYTGFAYHFTYTTNFWIGFVEKSWSNIFGHFWSLAVEEQYYLLAAPLLLLISARWSRAIVIGFIAVGAISLPIMSALKLEVIQIYAFPTPNFALISLGGLLAIDRPRFNFVHGLIGLMLIAISTYEPCVTWTAQFVGSGAAFITIAPGLYLFIGFIASSQSHWLIRALEFKPLKFIGTISYGIYIYHIAMPFRSIGGTSIPALWGGSYNFALGYTIGAICYFSLTVLLAWISWKYLEQPFIALKSKYSPDGNSPAKLGNLPPAT